MYLKLRPHVQEGLSEDDSKGTDDEDKSHSLIGCQSDDHQSLNDERKEQIRKIVYDEIENLVKLRLEDMDMIPFSSEEKCEDIVWGRGCDEGPISISSRGCQLLDGLSDEEQKANEECLEQSSKCKGDHSLAWKQKSKRGTHLKHFNNKKRESQTKMTDNEMGDMRHKSTNEQEVNPLVDGVRGLRSIQHIFYVPKQPEPLSASVSSSGVQSSFSKKNKMWSRGVVVYPVAQQSDGSKSETPLRSEQVASYAPSLKFESLFESGNLEKAIRIGEYSYDLVLHPDVDTHRHTQWYYFQVENAVPGVSYHFTIVNLRKKDSLYNHGLRPLFYSTIDAQENNIGWVRTGHSISYSRNHDNHNDSTASDVLYYQLLWQMEFPHADDITYLAHCYPYTYTDLQTHLISIQTDEKTSQFCKQDVLCRTLGGKDCYILTITDFENDSDDKQGVFLCGRVHPGESNSSWMIHGLIDFLTSQHKKARELRQLFVFQIIPMLNPDGVAIGNYRCSLSARDLNRQYLHPVKKTYPTVYNAKQAINTLKQKRKVLLFCDFHGHSRKHNVFMYGCQEKMAATPLQFLNHRLFPFLMASKAKGIFTFAGCKFHIAKCKESTARVVMWRQLNVMNSFTLEATFAGSTLEKYVPRHFHCGDFMSVGQSFAESVLDYWHCVSQPFVTSQYADLIECLVSSTHRSCTMQTQSCFTLDCCLPTVHALSHSCEPAQHQPLSRQELIDVSKILSDEDIEWILECESSNDSDSCSSSDETDSTKVPVNRQKRKKRAHNKMKKKDRKVEKREEKKERFVHVAKVEAHQCEKEKKERLPELNMRGLPVKQATRAVKCSVTVKPYKFVNPYTNRSNGGIPIFSQERSQERAKKKLERERGRVKQEAELIRASQSKLMLPLNTFFAQHDSYCLSPPHHVTSTKHPNSTHQSTFDSTLMWQTPFGSSIRSCLTVGNSWSPWLLKSHTVGPAAWGDLDAQTSLFKL